jgi:hypothetical protein
MQIETHNRRVAETPALQTQTGPVSAALAQQRQKALARWDNEGGAGPDGPQSQSGSGNGDNAAVPMTNTELVQLRIRVIALENLLIAVLAEGSGRQIELAVEMAKHISPRPGFTRHPLTIQAASHMLSLVERSGYLKSPQAAPEFAKQQLPTGGSG